MNCCTLTKFHHVCFALDLICKTSLPVEGKTDDEGSNRRESKVGPTAAAHIASVLDTPGAELVCLISVSKDAYSQSSL